MAINDLGLFLVGQLDTESSVTKINSDIKKLHGQLSHLRIKVGLDKSSLGELQKQLSKIQTMTGAVSNAGSKKGINLGLDSSEAKKYAQGLDQVAKGMEKVVTHSKMNEDSMMEANKIITQQTDSMGRLVEKHYTLNKETNEWENKNTKISDNMRQRDKDHAKALKENQKIDEARLKQTTETQSSIEKTILGSNENISQQKQRMGKLDAHEQEEMWKQLLTKNELHSRASLQKISAEQSKATVSVKEQQVAYNQLNNLLKQRSAIKAKLIGADKATTVELQKQLTLIQQQVNAQSKTIGTGGFKNEGMAAQVIQQEKVRMAERNVKLAKYNKGLDDTNKKMLAQTNMHNQIAKNMTVFESFTIAMKRIPIWMAGMTAFYAPLRSFQGGLSGLIEIDSQLIELRKVSGATRAELEEMRVTALQLGTQLGMTADKVLESSVAFSRMGYDMKQSAELAKEAITLSTVGNMGIDEATQSMISVMKAYNLELGDYEGHIRSAIDSVNELGNNFAISQKDLTEILRRSSSAMNEAGNTLEQTMA